MIYENNYVGVGDEKSIIHAKRWDVYMDEPESTHCHNSIEEPCGGRTQGAHACCDT